MDQVPAKELIRQLFSGKELLRLPFIPWLYGHAAKLEQISVRAMSTDPGKLSAALQNAWKLYGHDAITTPFDLTLEAEASGCSLTWQHDNQPPDIVPMLPVVIDAMDIEKRGRLPVVLEATRRIKTVLGQKVPLIAVIAGPLSLAARLLGKDILQELADNREETIHLLNNVCQVLTKTCQAFCELEPEVVAIADEYVLRLAPRDLAVVSSLFRTISNLVWFYNSHPILVTRLVDGEDAGIVADMPFDGVAVGGHPEPTAIKRLVDKGLVVGIGIPFSVASGPTEKVASFISEYLSVTERKRLFISLEWEVPYHTPPEHILSLVKTIASL